MKTNTKKQLKASIVTLCALLLIFATILGTLAYLTDTKTVTNTFTVGNVQIKLDEAKVNVDGNPVDENGNVVADIKDATRTDSGNGNDPEKPIKIVPAKVVTKDPTITVVAGSEACYVRAKVTVTFVNGTKNATDYKTDHLDDMFSGIATTGEWTFIEGTAENTSVVYEYRYKNVVAYSDSDTKLAPVFSTITMPKTWTHTNMSEIGGMKIVVTAQAIQAEGFANADAAWAEFPNA